MRWSWKVFVLAVVIIVTSMITSGSAMMWQPYQFEPKNQEYEYKITSYEGEIEKVSIYELVMEEKESGQMEVSVKTTWSVGGDELDQQILGGWWAGGAFGLTMAFINPMYAAFFGGLDLKVGNKMSFFGAGVVEVTGTEKVAGRTGFVCQLLNEDGGIVLGRYVVDPTVPLPLKTELFEEDGAKQFETELQRIEF
jgi:hypothetical protein